MSFRMLIIAATAAAGIAGVIYAQHEPDLEQIKSDIASNFSAKPEAFDFDAAVQRLADVRIEGEYAICATNAEITGQQYVEVSALVDQYQTKIMGLKLALNSALYGEGISDCDYRVLMLLINDYKLKEMAGNPKGLPATPATAART